MVHNALTLIRADHAHVHLAQGRAVVYAFVATGIPRTPSVHRAYRNAESVRSWGTSVLSALCDSSHSSVPFETNQTKTTTYSK